jgi:hypothetical protein
MASSFRRGTNSLRLRGGGSTAGFRSPLIRRGAAAQLRRPLTAAKLTDAQTSEIVELREQLTREQRAGILHLARLMLLRQEVDAEIKAIQEAAEDGHWLAAPTAH